MLVEKCHELVSWIVTLGYYRHGVFPECHELVSWRFTFDPARSLALVEGDQQLLTEMIALFLIESPPLLAALQHSSATGQCEQLRQAAHTLKGMAGNFGAHKVVTLAYELERMGRTGQTTGAIRASATLAAEIKRLNAALKAFAAGNLSARTAALARPGAAQPMTV